MLSHVWLSATMWIAAHQSPLSMEFSRQEDWSGLSFPFSREASWPKHPSHISCVSCIGREILFQLSHPGSPNKGGDVFKFCWSWECLLSMVSAMTISNLLNLLCSGLWTINLRIWRIMDGLNKWFNLFTALWKREIFIFLASIPLIICS